MLTREGKLRSERTDLSLAGVLAAVAGAVNGASFYAAGFLSANMTGNVAAASNRIALGDITDAAFYLLIVLFFISGACLTALVVNAAHRRNVNGIYAYIILLEGGLLIAMGGVDISVAGSWRVHGLVLGLAFLMGLQNAVVTRISGARIRTTHVSGMITDFGIELAVLIDTLRGKIAWEASTESRAALILHLSTVIAFFAGGVVGVLFYGMIGGWMFVVLSSLMTWLSLSAIHRLRAHPSVGRDSQS